MAGIKISALPVLPSALGTDVAPWVQSGVTYQGSVSQLQTFFQANLSFLPLSGGTMTGAINMGSHQINSLTNPTLAQDAATKAYVDAVAQGITVQGAARLGTIGALTVTYANGASGVGATLTNATTQAALTLDGVAAVVNDRILVKNQAAAAQNGIYTVTNIGSGATNWVMTRATDYDLPAQINAGDLVIITAGNTLASSSWIETATVTTIGTDAISFSQFSASLPITVPNGGTGLTTTTAYGIITGGTTATGNFQNAGTGLTGTILQGNGASALPTFSTATYPSVATGAGTWLRADGTNWVAATTTYPNTNAINTLLYASSANVMSALATANSATLITNASGVPGWSSSPAITRINYLQITSTSTYTPTAGTQYIDVEVQGSGGAGGGAAATTGTVAAGSGGGAGGNGKRTFTIAQVGATAAAVVGAGGVAGSVGNNPGGNGNATSLTLTGSGSIALSGAGGSGGLGSAAAAGIVVAGQAGGTATNATLAVPGQAGGSSVGAVNAQSFVFSGAGGNSALGWGGGSQATVSSPNATGAAGSGFGSGGSGALSFSTGIAAAGGAGAIGVINIREYISV